MFSIHPFSLPTFLVLVRMELAPTSSSHCAMGGKHSGQVEKLYSSKCIALNTPSHRVFGFNSQKDTKSATSWQRHDMLAYSACVLCIVFCVSVIKQSNVTAFNFRAAFQLSTDHVSLEQIIMTKSALPA